MKRLARSTPDHPRSPLGFGLALVVAISIAAPTLAETIAGTHLEAAMLVAELPWTFEARVEPPSTREGGQEPVWIKRYHFKTMEPIDKTAAGATYLRADLTTSEHAGTEFGRSALEDLLTNADPDTGLSYAWDHLLQSGAMVYHLHAGCTFSEDAFQKMAGRIEEAVRHRPFDLRVVTCRCGGGCRERSGKGLAVSE